MNSKPKRKILNEIFKRFQQLPDWPLTKLEQKNRQEKQMKKAEAQLLLPPSPRPDSSASQTLAE